MVIRIFAYGFSKAKEMANLDENRGKAETTIYMPRQLVIYIEPHEKIKDELRLRIVYPEGDEYIYTVPIMKYWEFGTPDLLEKKLYPLLPLQVFKLRRKLNLLKKRKHTPEQLQELLQEARKITEEVGTVSRHLYEQHIITGEDLNKILTALGNLIRYLNLKYGYVDQIIEEVEKMLKTLYDPVVEEKGREKGREEGREEGLKTSIQYNLAELEDYDLYKERLDDQLKALKDIPMLLELIKASARTKNVKEFMKLLVK